jgi:hypothetical protein
MLPDCQTARLRRRLCVEAQSIFALEALTTAVMRKQLATSSLPKSGVDRARGSMPCGSRRSKMNGSLSSLAMAALVRPLW